MSVAPVVKTVAKFTVGQNPASMLFGSVSFFHKSSRVLATSLYVYDGSGSLVKKLAVSDNTPTGKQAVASWDLRDAKGRPVPVGTYLVKGVLVTANGKREAVSAVVGVR